MVSLKRDTSMTIDLLSATSPLSMCMAWIGLATTAMACSTPPRPDALPMHAPGLATALKWPDVLGAKGYMVLMQWKAPEGPVVKTLETSIGAPEVSIPASPEPWRPLMLQVELVSLCAKEAGDVSRSPPALLRQLQFDPAQLCSPVEGLRPVRGPSGQDGSPAPYQQLRWADQPGGRVEITWFDGLNGKPLAKAEAQGPQAPWALPARPPALIRATRSCSAGRQSTPTYLLVPR